MIEYVLSINSWRISYAQYNVTKMPMVEDEFFNKRMYHVNWMELHIVLRTLLYARESFTSLTCIKIMLYEILFKDMPLMSHCLSERYKNSEKGITWSTRHKWDSTCRNQHWVSRMGIKCHKSHDPSKRHDQWVTTLWHD